ncbi:hypothetical protein CEH78_003071 [Salmonella enterica]|nr:hypothetical protein [Salmonella enterica]
MSKHHTARLVGIRLNQMCHQRRGSIPFRFDFDELIPQHLRERGVTFYSPDRPETTPDSVNNQDAKSALRGKDGKL